MSLLQVQGLRKSFGGVQAVQGALGVDRKSVV